MGIKVSTAVGAEVEFPDGTDASTIRSVMARASGGSPQKAGPKEFGIDWSGPEDQVRAAVGALPETDRQDARRQWADAYVAKEGGGTGIDNTVRTLARGTLVGPFLDEANAATSNPLAAARAAIWGESDPKSAPYYEALEYQRARDRSVDKSAPVLSTVGKLAGGIAGVGGALASVGRGGAGVAERVARGMAAGPVASMAPAQTAVGRLGQGAALGAGYGAATGYGEGSGGVSKRADSAIGGAMFGGVAGGVLTGLAEVGGRVAGHMAGARAAARSETDGAGQGALVAMSRGLERDRIAPDAIISQIRSEFPDTTAAAGGNRFWGNARNGRQPWTQDQVDELVRRATAGEDAATISAALAVGGRGPGRAAVQTMLDEMRDRARGPLNLVDRAGLVRTGSGDNTQMTLRAAAATPGEARSIARENLLERQIGANGRLQQAFDRLIGSGDYDGVAARHAQALEEAGNAAYEAARQTEAPFDIAPIFQRWRQQYEGRRGPVPEAVLAGLDSMTGRMPVRNPETGMVIGHQPRLPQTLQEFIDARQNLRAAIEAPGASNVVRSTLRQLRDDLSNEVRRTNPAWGAANDIWRDGTAATDMLEAGARMSTRLNTRSREAVAEFQAAQQAERRARRAGDAAGVAAAQSQQELFRVGLVRSLNDEIVNKGVTHDLTRTLRLPGARSMLETVLGRERAAQLFRVVDAEHAMLRTHQSQFGSQTTPLKEAIDDLNWAPRFNSALELANPAKALQVGGEMIAARLNAARNQSMMPMMTDTNMMRQLETLRALQGITGARNSARMNWGRQGQLGAAGAGMLAGRGMSRR